MDRRPLVLWADDEIEMLRPHIMFLENHGYDLLTVNNGLEAIEKSSSQPVDVVILDEHMPGISGLRALSIIKEKNPYLPVIMLTKSEEEDIMDKAIGSKITDYLIKPVNPRQILSSLKKITMGGRLVSEMSASRYTADFNEISGRMGKCETLSDWQSLYERLVYWHAELNDSSSADASESLGALVENQMQEAEKLFFRFIRNNYRQILSDAEITMSHTLLEKHIVPPLSRGDKLWLIVVDNFRLDQWNTLRDMLSPLFRIEESLGCSILPTSTQYSRNALFSGMLPCDIKKTYPGLWIDEFQDDRKNKYEDRLLQLFIERKGLKADVFYSHLNDSDSCSRILRNFNEIYDKDLKAIVVSFIDMMSHERTQSKTIRELSSTEAGYLSLTRSWFRHSPISELFAKIAATGGKIVLTTDHGTVRVTHPLKIKADKNSSDTLRYKVGRNLRFDSKDVMEVSIPQTIGLPDRGIASSYIFASGSDYFVYLNNYNQYVKLFEDTYQHGGISMQEMLVPIVTLTPK